MAGSNSLDVPVASLAGLAVAFLAFAAPADLLEGLVGATGIAALIPAAQPPLGLTARVALGAGGSVIVFAIALLLLRWLGRIGARPAAQVEEAAEPAAPRLRRRDFHPDAPARAPLLAAHDIGEPALELSQVAPEPEPAWVPEPQPEPIAEVQAEPEAEAPPAPPPPLLARKPDRTSPAPDPEPEAAQDPAAAAYALSQRNWADFEPEPEAEADMRYPSLERAAITREAAAETRASILPVEPTMEIEEEPGAPLEASWYAMQAEPEPNPPSASVETAPESGTAWSEPEPELIETSAEPVEPWAEELNGQAAPESTASEPFAPTPIHAEPVRPLPVGSIAELMERLEKGLARHRIDPNAPAAASMPTAVPPGRAATPRPINPDPSDDRLQSAIESLQRFASRQD